MAILERCRGVLDGGSFGRAGRITRKYRMMVTTPKAAKVASSSKGPSCPISFAFLLRIKDLE